MAAYVVLWTDLQATCILKELSVQFLYWGLHKLLLSLLLLLLLLLLKFIILLILLYYCYCFLILCPEVYMIPQGLNIK